jgi:hypothetical protein
MILRRIISSGLLIDRIVAGRAFSRQRRQYVRIGVVTWDFDSAQRLSDVAATKPPAASSEPDQAPLRWSTSSPPINEKKAP